MGKQRGKTYGAIFYRLYDRRRFSDWHYGAYGRHFKRHRGKHIWRTKKAATYSDERTCANRMENGRWQKSFEIVSELFLKTK